MLLIGLFGGLAIFLHGMDGMSEALRLMAGNSLRRILLRLTGNRFSGALTGAGVTAIVQSSSVTTVLLVGFVSSELMTLSQAVGVILGANVGTTITAQIIAFKVTDYALVAVAAGFLVSTVSKAEINKAKGQAFMGLGLVFFGMGLMGDAMKPLRDYDPFIQLMTDLSNPFYGILVGAAFTALVQSSSATTSLVIVLASQKLVPLDAGIALIFGANIGTSVTAQLAAFGKPRNALRTAYVHTLFNVIGVVIWFPFISVLASMVRSIGGDTARQIANAHTIFNVLNIVIFIGFTNQLAQLVVKLAPDRPAAEEAMIRSKYLDEALLTTPTLALDRAKLEMLRMFTRVQTMLADVMPAILTGSRNDLLAIEQMDDEVDSLHGQILEYLGKISKVRITSEQTEELVSTMTAVNDLEAMGDIIETNLVAIGMKRLEDNIEMSPETAAVLTRFHANVEAGLELARLAVTQDNEVAAHQIDSMKRTINEMEAEVNTHVAARLGADADDRIALIRLEAETVANLKRVFYFAKRVARTTFPLSARVDV